MVKGGLILVKQGNLILVKQASPILVNGQEEGPIQVEQRACGSHPRSGASSSSLAGGSGAFTPTLAGQGRALRAAPNRWDRGVARRRILRLPTAQRSRLHGAVQGSTGPGGRGRSSGANVAEPADGAGRTAPSGRFADPAGKGERERGGGREGGRDLNRTFLLIIDQYWTCLFDHYQISLFDQYQAFIDQYHTAGQTGSVSRGSAAAGPGPRRPAITYPHGKFCGAVHSCCEAEPEERTRRLYCRHVSSGEAAVSAPMELATRRAGPANGTGNPWPPPTRDFGLRPAPNQPAAFLSLNSPRSYSRQRRGRTPLVVKTEQGQYPAAAHPLHFSSCSCRRLPQSRDSLLQEVLSPA